MGKRSNFERRERDFYPTPREAVEPLFPFLPEKTVFAEPCCGDFDLVHHLEARGHYGIYAADISHHPDSDALKLAEWQLGEQFAAGFPRCDYIITNPPWSRDILHPMIDHFRNLRPTWLLFDAGWAFTKQSIPYIKYCSDIVAVGRVKWIPDSKYTGKDDCAWYQFQNEEVETIFHGRQ